MKDGLVLMNCGTSNFLFLLLCPGLMLLMLPFFLSTIYLLQVELVIVLGSSGNHYVILDWIIEATSLGVTVASSPEGQITVKLVLVIGSRSEVWLVLVFLPRLPGLQYVL